MHAIEKHLIENLTRTVSRRTLLKGGLAAGFTLAFHLPLHAADEMDPPAKCPQDFAPNGFIRVGHSGKTTLTMPQVEIGQGVYTAIP
jgi:isoquinoline 1-oxidoreductase subunit beta